MLIIIQDFSEAADAARLRAAYCRLGDLVTEPWRAGEEPADLLSSCVAILPLVLQVTTET